MPIRLIGFDGDDTLWYHGREFMAVQRRILAAVKRYASENEWANQFPKTEVENIKFYGYGVSSFILSAIEAAIHVTRGRIPPYELAEFVSIGRRMVDHDIEVIKGTREVLLHLKRDYKLLLITKGEKAEQQRKIEKSEITPIFDGVEIVHEKDAGVYTSVLLKYRCQPKEFLMIGNSLKSDVLPVLALGGWAVHIPSEIIWHNEQSPTPTSHARFFLAEGIGCVPAIVSKIGSASDQPAGRPI